MVEAYSGLRPEDIHRDFLARQESSAEAIFCELLPFLQRGEVTTILDIGCGSGEILTGVHRHIRKAFEENPENLSSATSPGSRSIGLIGMDSAEGQIERALSKSNGLSTPNLSLTFSQCDPNRLFLDHLADHNIVLGKTAVICSSHTIFHLPYLPKLFDGLANDPDCRPLLWLVDIFHSWDDALKYLDKNPKSDFLEPIQFRDKGGQQIVDTLFTRLAPDGFVKRGLQEAHNGKRQVTAETHQLRWTTCDLHDQFFRCGYSLRQESVSLRGWGEMKTFLFVLPPNCIGVSEVFMDSNETMPAIQRKVRGPDLETIFKDAPPYSPNRQITNWIHQWKAIDEFAGPDSQDANKGAFDFILVEYAPWHDMWKKEGTLSQEISLILRKGALPLDSSEVIHRYNRTARSFQDLDLGMFLHPYLTKGGTEQWGVVTSSFHLSTRSGGSRAASIRGPQPATENPADGKSLLRSEPNWRNQWWPKLVAHYETADPETKNIKSADGPAITTYARSDYSQFKLLEERAELENRIISRIENYNHVTRDANGWHQTVSGDYERTIELFHLFVRDKLCLNAPNNPMRTFMISAPLRLNRITASYEPRGGIWIFAGTRGNYSCHLIDTLRNLLRQCLLVGSMTVEASANKSTNDGLHHYAAQAASAAVMSRNMSHNIGSHPLAAISSSEKVLDVLGSKSILGSKSKIDVGAARIGNFLGYMRNRMDYIASISTDVPRWGLTADLRQVVEEFCFVAEKQDAGNGKDSGRAREPTWLIERLTELDGTERPTISFCEAAPQKIPFLLPHGVVGKQALFSIFENVLRNSDKYGDPAKKQRGQIMVQVKDRDEHLEVTLIDKGSSICAEKRLVEDLTSYLEDSFYNTKPSDTQKGEMSRKYWGLKEMKISAAYLRMRAGVEAESYSSEKDDPWIKPLSIEGYLGWQFVILKPKLALVDRALTGPGDNLDACKNIGIKFFDPSRLGEELKNGVPHSFLVVRSESWCHLDKLDDLSLNMLPLRRILIGPKPDTLSPGWACIDSLSVGNGADLEQTLYRGWNKKLAGNADVPDGSLVPILATQDAPLEPKEEGGCLISEAKSFSTGQLDCLSDKRLIVFERHSENPDGIYYRTCCWRTDHCSDHVGLWSNVGAYMGISHGSTPWEQTEEARTNGAMAGRLIEAGLVQIFVLDDRVAKELKRSLGKRLKLAAAGVITLPFADESNIQDAEIAPARLAEHLQTIRSRFPAAKPGMVIVTIHQTILDKLKSGNPKCWMETIERELPTLIGAPVAVVVHSGRGRPGALFEKEKLQGHRFLEFSNLQAFMLDPGYKSFLVDIFLAVRA